METPAVRTENLRRIYKRPRRRNDADPEKELIALDGVDLEVHPGELFGLLGPNGAGKTTLIKILTTLLAPTSGTAWVDGLDVVQQAQQVRPRINMVSGGESSGYGVLNVRENLWLFTQIYGVPSHVAGDRIDQMLDIVGLSEKATTRVSHLSTGQRQKMNFCRGFLTDPKILFLDEPTLGLDVTSARRIRGFIRDWMKVDPERTLLLTTHYMTEADDLCDRLAIIDHGKVLACDTPDNLKKQVQAYPVFELKLTGEHDPSDSLRHQPGVRQLLAESDPTTLRFKLILDEPGAIGPVVQTVLQAGCRIAALKEVELTLEDVFIELVGHGLNEPTGEHDSASS